MKIWSRRKILKYARSQIELLRQMQSMYSNSEVYRAASGSTYQGIDLFYSSVYVVSLIEPCEGPHIASHSLLKGPV